MQQLFSVLGSSLLVRSVLTTATQQCFSFLCVLTLSIPEELTLGPWNITTTESVPSSAKKGMDTSIFSWKSYIHFSVPVHDITHRIAVESGIWLTRKRSVCESLQGCEHTVPSPTFHCSLGWNAHRGSLPNYCLVNLQVLAEMQSFLIGLAQIMSTSLPFSVITSFLVVILLSCMFACPLPVFPQQKAGSVREGSLLVLLIPHPQPWIQNLAHPKCSIYICEMHSFLSLP